MDDRTVLEQEAVDTEVEDLELPPELNKLIKARLLEYEQQVRDGTVVYLSEEEVYRELSEECGEEI